MRLVLASSNPGKLRELAALLQPLGWEISPQDRFGITPPPETGATFVENALLKARHAARLANLPAIADDSGIEVDALNGAPGVYSARYAGPGASDEENLQKLLRELAGVPLERRTARYRAVIVYVRSHDDAQPLIADGCWEGRIAEHPRGSNGFGYDPIFLPEGMERTAAELTPQEKNAISHRAKALRELAAQLGAPGV